MKIYFKHLLIVSLSTLLFGCGNEPDYNSRNNSMPGEDEAVRPGSELLDTQLDALEQARDVEQSMLDAVEAREKEMREKGI